MLEFKIKEVNDLYHVYTCLVQNDKRCFFQWSTGLKTKGNKKKVVALVDTLNTFYVNCLEEEIINEYFKLNVQKQIFLFLEENVSENELTPRFLKKMNTFLEKYKNTFIDYVYKNPTKSVQSNSNISNSFLKIYGKQTNPSTAINLDETVDNSDSMEDCLFIDFFRYWFNTIQQRDVASTTYCKQAAIILKRDIPYFQVFSKPLSKMKAKDFSIYYSRLESGYILNNITYKPIGPTSIYQHHTLFKKCMDYAKSLELIPYNPVIDAKYPRKKQETPKTVYSIEELEQLFTLMRGKPFEYPILMASYYGMRRSEILGLKWSDIDFKKKEFLIQRGVHYVKIDGRMTIQVVEHTKTASSTRKLPLIAPIENMLNKIKEETMTNYKKLQNQYYLGDSDFVFVDRFGHLKKPETVSLEFKKFLRKNNMKYISMHNLRHTVGTILCENNQNLEKIKEWLGHSSVQVTSKHYLHMDFQSKIETGNLMESLLEQKGDKKIKK